MREVKVESVGQLVDGAKVRCVVGGTIIEDGMLAYEKGNWFVLQNLKNGERPEDMRGYLYSWWIADDRIGPYDVSDLVMLLPDEKAKPKRAAPEHMGYRVGGEVYTLDAVGEDSVESIRLKLVEHRRSVKNLTGVLRRHARIAERIRRDLGGGK